MTLFRLLTFLVGWLIVILTVLLFWIFFLPLENSDFVFLLLSIDFPLNAKQDAPFHRKAYDYSHADWDDLRDHLRDVLWEDIFKRSSSSAAS